MVEKKIELFVLISYQNTVLQYFEVQEWLKVCKNISLDVAVLLRQMARILCVRVFFVKDGHWLYCWPVLMKFLIIIPALFLLLFHLSSAMYLGCFCSGQWITTDIRLQYIVVETES